MRQGPKFRQPVQNFAFGGIANPGQRSFLRGSDRRYLDARQAELDAFEKERQGYNTALQTWQDQVYKPYQAQADAYNAAAQQYNTDVYQPYQQRVGEYNTALEAYNRDVYDPYVAKYNTYQTAIDEWNAGPRETEYAGPAAPTLASTFSMTAPTAPDPFSMAAPVEPEGFTMAAPTLPFKEEDVVQYQKASADRARKDAQNRGAAIDAVADPSKYNLSGFGVTNRFMAQGGPVESSARDMMSELTGRVASAGRGGDEMLAYLSPSSAQMLKDMGGAGTVNPETGLREYRFNIEELRRRYARPPAPGVNEGLTFPTPPPPPLGYSSGPIDRRPLNISEQPMGGVRVPTAPPPPPPGPSAADLAAAEVARVAAAEEAARQAAAQEAARQAAAQKAAAQKAAAQEAARQAAAEEAARQAAAQEAARQAAAQEAARQEDLRRIAREELERLRLKRIEDLRRSEAGSQQAASDEFKRASDRAAGRIVVPYGGATASPIMASRPAAVDLQQLDAARALPQVNLSKAPIPGTRPSIPGTRPAGQPTSQTPVGSQQPPNQQAQEPEQPEQNRPIRVSNAVMPEIGAYGPVGTAAQRLAAMDPINYFARSSEASPGMLPGTVSTPYNPLEQYTGPSPLEALADNPNLTPRILGGAQNAGVMTDRLGNKIFSPGAGLFGYAKGGEVEAEPEEEEGSESRQMLDEYSPTAKTEFLKTKKQASPTAKSASKLLSLDMGSLTEMKDFLPKGSKTAKADLQQLAKQYKLKGQRAENMAKGFQRNTLGAPTLEQPTLTEGEFLVKRFEKGGAAKKEKPPETPSIFGVKDYAAKTSERMFPNQRGQDDQRDAARHMLAAASLAKGLGPKAADFFGKAHEYMSNPQTFFSSIGAGEPREDLPYDMHNNRLGIELAARAKDQAEIEALVKEMALQAQYEQTSGKPWIMSPKQMQERIERFKKEREKLEAGTDQQGYAEGGEVKDEDLSGPITKPMQFNKKQKRGRISEALNDPSASAYANMAKGASELPYDILGAPVDIATMLMRPASYSVEKPVGGSEFIKQKMTQAGVRPEPPSDSVDKGFYTAGELLSNLTNPAGVTRSAARGAGKAADMLEDVTVGNVQRAKVRRAGKQAEATPESAYDPLRQRMESEGLLSYAVRPTGSTMISGDIAGQPGDSIVDNLVAQAKNSAKRSMYPDPDKLAAVNNFWDTKAKNYFLRQFGTPNDPIADALSKGRIRSSVSEETFPRYMIDQIGVGKTRVNPRTGESQFFPKYPEAIDDFTSRYDKATGLTGSAYVPGMGNQDYSSLVSREGKLMRRDLMTKEEDKLLDQGLRPGMINPDVTLVTESALDPNRIIFEGFGSPPPSVEQVVSAYKNNASLPQELRVPLERGEPLYDSSRLKAPLSDLLDPPNINLYLAGLSPREISKIRFEDAVVGASKIEQRSNVLQSLFNKIRAGKTVSNDVFSRGVSAPLMQVKEGPLEGFAWKRITDREATVPEGAYMGHSVAGYELGGATYTTEKREGFNNGLYEIYSLRDNRNRPVNTIEVKNDPTFGKTVTQIKGNGRASGNVPATKYDTAIFDFLANHLRPARITEDDGMLTPILQQYKMQVNSGSQP